MTRTRWIHGVIAACLTTPCFAANPAQANVVAITGSTVVDLGGGRPLRNAVVIVENERIVAIGSSDEISIPETARTIRADDTWLLPGLMNMHVHFGDDCRQPAGNTAVLRAHRVTGMVPGAP